MPLSSLQRERLLARVLLILGIVDLLALPAIVLPFETMESVHRQLGLGTLNESSLVN